MQKLFIHIGMPKTGTTSLQFVMARHRKQLANQGVCYPATMRNPTPTTTQHRFVNSYMRQQAERVKAGLPILYHAVNSVAQEITKKGLPHNIISEELFSYEPAFAAEFLSKFREKFDTKIVVFLRRQDIWVESMYAQSVRGGYKPDFETFCKARPTVQRLDLLEFLGHWAGNFGRENVIVIPYVEQKTNSYEALLPLLGNPKIRQTEKEARNPSLSSEAIEFIRNAIDLNEVKNPVFNELFGTDLNSVTEKAKPIYLTPEARTKFLAKYEDDNNAVLRDYLGKDPKTDSLFEIDPETFPPSDAVQRELSIERQIEILTSLLKKKGVDVVSALKKVSDPVEQKEVLSRKIVDLCVQHDTA